jgi:uncharacterized protein (TIGR03085 family)
MTNPAQAERAALCDLFLQVGPDAPTLSGDWTTRDLAAHLVVRERRPDAAAGIVARMLAGYSEKVRLLEAERPYTEIVDRVRKGPPRWSPTSVEAVDRLVNTVEFYVHHEDVRRGAAPFAVRELDVELEEALVRLLSGPLGKALVRKASVGVAIEPEGHPGARLRRGARTVAVAGPIGEIVLFLYGRSSVAQVDFEGDDDAIAKLKASSFGF